MILDDGICTIYRLTDVSEAGEMPARVPVMLWQSWYKELDFETNPVYPTEYQRDVEITTRIRITQDRRINNRDIVCLNPDPQQGDQCFQVTRAFHGRDDENGSQITDLTLEAITYPPFRAEGVDLE